MAGMLCLTWACFVLLCLFLLDAYLTWRNCD